jgi:hypothetical protein
MHEHGQAYAFQYFLRDIGKAWQGKENLHLSNKNSYSL